MIKSSSQEFFYVFSISITKIFGVDDDEEDDDDGVGGY